MEELLYIYTGDSVIEDKRILLKAQISQPHPLRLERLACDLATHTPIRDRTETYKRRFCKNKLSLS